MATVQASISHSGLQIAVFRQTIRIPSYRLVKRSGSMTGTVKIKITVLKRTNPSEVFQTSPVTLIGPTGPCDVFQDGQEFTVENFAMPQGFCPVAWIALSSNIRLLSYGCNFPWIKEEGVTINCCTDGLRPVIFKIERIK